MPIERVDALKRAMRLNPLYPDWYLWNFGEAYFNLCKYDEAIQTVQKNARPIRGAQTVGIELTRCSVNLPEARHHAAQVLAVHPDFSLEHWRTVPPYKNPEFARTVHRRTAAGWPAIVHRAGAAIRRCCHRMLIVAANPGHLAVHPAPVCPDRASCPDRAQLTRSRHLTGPRQSGRRTGLDQTRPPGRAGSARAFQSRRRGGPTNLPCRRPILEVGGELVLRAAIPLVSTVLATISSPAPWTRYSVGRASS